MFSIGLVGGLAYGDLATFSNLVATGGAGACLTGVSVLYGQKALKQESVRLMETDALNSAYRRIYSSELAEKDEFTKVMWRRVREHLLRSFSSVDLVNVSGDLSARSRSADLATLERILSEDVPRLRRQSAPML